MRKRAGRVLAYKTENQMHVFGFGLGYINPNGDGAGSVCNEVEGVIEVVKGGG
jgi:hypothetical protein